MLVSNEFEPNRELYSFGQNVSYDGTCDATSIRNIRWNASFPDFASSGPRIQFRKILRIAQNERITIFICLTITLMSDSSGKEYWECGFEGDRSNSFAASGPREALLAMYEEVAENKTDSNSRLLEKNTIT